MIDPEFFEKIPPSIWDKVFQLNLDLSKENQNPDIVELLHRTTLFGGKRFRPLLFFLMGHFFDIPSQKSAPFARAIELVHAASLAHDDVIDEATTRRGRESINVAACNKRAVLAGDYLLANVIVELCRLGDIHLVSEMSLVIKDLSDGEWLQLEGQKSTHLTWDHIEKVAEKKTASVMSWCCVAPAILAKASEEVVEDCRSFGRNLGLAFQFIDDTLDFNETSGKDPLQDMKNGIINSVSFEVLQENPSLAEALRGAHDLTYVSSMITLQNTEFQKAAMRVREKAHVKLKLARDLLYKIISGHRFGSEESVRPLLHVLDYLHARKR